MYKVHGWKHDKVGQPLLFFTKFENIFELHNFFKNILQCWVQTCSNDPHLTFCHVLKNNGLNNEDGVIDLDWLFKENINKILMIQNVVAIYFYVKV